MRNFSSLGVTVEDQGDSASLIGTASSDILAFDAAILSATGLGGDDLIVAFAASDTNLDGGAGNDVIASGAGDDDGLFGQAGDDLLSGGPGDDVNILGGPGVDILLGGSGDDVLEGGDGDDVLYGGFGADDLRGGIGRDFMSGGLGPDRFIFAPGDALLGFSDEITGFEDGLDVIVFEGFGSLFELDDQTVTELTAPSPADLPVAGFFSFATSGVGVVVERDAEDARLFLDADGDGDLSAADVVLNFFGGATIMFDDLDFPGVTVTPSNQAVILEGVYTDDLTLDPSITYILRGQVVIGVDAGPDPANPLPTADPAVLTILAGTTVYAEPGSSLVITRGSQVIADGRQDAPITFTTIDELSGPVDPLAATARWGGIYLNGRATINDPSTPGGDEAFGEGGTGLFGGTDDADSSGLLRFFRVLYSGETQGLDELNGLSLQGVGDGTTLEFIQVHNTNDDAIEFIGGTVDARYVVVTGANDDSIDWTDGWRGDLQFGLVVQNPGQAKSDNGVEADNLNGTPDTLPRSEPTLSNLTLIGAGDQSVGDRGVLLRAGTAGDIGNTVITNWASSGLDINDPETATQESAGQITLPSTLIDSATNGDPTDTDADGIDEDVIFAAQINSVVGPTSLQQDSAIGAAFINGPNEQAVTPTDFSLIDPFFVDAGFIGAVNSVAPFDPVTPYLSNWTQGWTVALDLFEPPVATFTVTTIKDDGDDATVTGDLDAEIADGDGLSLREAIELTNAASGRQRIDFDSSLNGSTIVLKQGELTVTDKVIVDGDVDGDDVADIVITGDALGDDLTTTVSGFTVTDAVGNTNTADNSRVIGTVGSVELDIRSLVITGGYADGPLVEDRLGAGIYARSSSGSDATISDSILAGNRAASGGGGVAALGSNLTIERSLIEGNDAGLEGAGVLNTGGVLTIDATDFIANRSADRGGALSHYLNNGVITNSTFDANTAAGLGGGAIINSGDLTIDNSDFLNNSATTAGAVYSFQNKLVVTNSYFQNNSASVSGGAITNANTAVADIQNTTFKTNDAIASGGAVHSLQPIDLTNVTLDGNQAKYGGGVYLDDVATITGGAIQNNVATQDGGGIFNSVSGTLDVAGVTISSNDATSGKGGGVYNSGDTTVTGASTFGSNTAGTDGGGAFNAGLGTLRLVDSFFATNDAASFGGGVLNEGVLTISQSEFQGNTAGVSGGAIGNSGGSALLTTVNTILYDNTATTLSGGGLYNTGGQATLVNAQLVGNTAAVAGGGFWTDSNADLINSTVTGNKAVSDGGGVFVDTLGVFTVDVGNSIVAGNDAAMFADVFDGAANVTWLGDNLVEQGGPPTPNVTFGASPASIFDDATKTYPNGVTGGALAPNGGFIIPFIDTVAILNGGLAQNAGDGAVPVALDENALGVDLDNDGATATVFATVNDLLFDVRGAGFGRTIDGQIDLGAFEDQTAAPPPFADTAGDDGALSDIPGQVSTITAQFDLFAETFDGVDSADSLDAATNSPGGVLRTAFFASPTQFTLSSSDGSGPDTFQNFTLINFEPGDQAAIQADDNITLAGGSGSIFGASVSFNAVDDLTGGAGANSLTGDVNPNTLSGLAGIDTLNGGGGADTLIGGTGADTLTGAGGADVFKFAHADSLNGSIDNVTDFDDGAGDTIDVTALSLLGSLADEVPVGAFTNTALNDPGFFSASPGGDVTGGVVIETSGGDALVFFDFNNSGDYEAGADDVIKFTAPVGLDATDFGLTDVASILVVTNTNDAGGGSLRQAILDANAAPGLNTITFDNAVFGGGATITLASDLPGVNDDVTIDGDSDGDLINDNVTIDGASMHQPFNVDGAYTVNFSFLTVQNTAALIGGAIYSNNGAFVISDSAILTANANIGGAIYAAGASTINLTDTTIDGASTGNDGGAIYARDTSAITLTGAQLLNNQASMKGGAIYARDNATVVSVNSTFDNNDANMGPGGGIFAQDAVAVTLTNTDFTNHYTGSTGEGGAIAFTSTGALAITGGLFDSNKATALGGRGGAIYTTGTTTIDGATLSNNESNGNGGGIYADGVLTLVNATLSGNIAGAGGGALFNGGTARIVNSTLSANEAGTNGGVVDSGVGSVELTIVNGTLHGNYAGGNGGAVGSVATFLNIVNSTITGNKADTDGGGVFASGGGTNNVINTLIVGNADAGGSDETGGAAPLINTASLIGGDPTLIFDATTTDPAGAAVGVLPGGVLSGVLAGNGGLNDTVAIKNGGPAQNAGNGTAAIGTTIDETALGVDVNGDGDALDMLDSIDDFPFDARGAGFPRIFDGQIDLGAFEEQTAATPLFADTVGDDGVQTDAAGQVSTITAQFDAFGETFDGADLADTLDTGAQDDVVVFFTTLGGSEFTITDGVAATDTFQNFENFANTGINTTVDADEPSLTLTGGAINVNGVALAGVENIQGGGSVNTIQGDDAANRLADGAGTDTIRGGKGDDVIAPDLDGTTDTLFDGELGVDTLDLSAAPATTDLTVDLAAATFSDSAFAFNLGGQPIANFENVIGGDGDDALTGDANANVLEGGDGEDDLTGGLGADTFTYDLASESALGDIDDITDFTLGDGDKIDVSAFGPFTGSARVDTPGLFTNAAAPGFFAGDVVVIEESGGDSRLFLDANGDDNLDANDLVIELTGTGLGLDGSAAYDGVTITVSVFQTDLDDGGSTLFGAGAGNDTLKVQGNSSADTGETFDAKGGTDTVDTSLLAAGVDIVSFDLASGAYAIVDAGVTRSDTNTLVNFEVVNGGPGGTDTLSGDFDIDLAAGTNSAGLSTPGFEIALGGASANVLTAATGALSALQGGGGADTLTGQIGTFVVFDYLAFSDSTFFAPDEVFDFEPGAFGFDIIDLADITNLTVTDGAFDTDPSGPAQLVLTDAVTDTGGDGFIVIRDDLGGGDFTLFVDDPVGGTPGQVDGADLVVIFRAAQPEFSDITFASAPLFMGTAGADTFDVNAEIANATFDGGTFDALGDVDTVDLSTIGVGATFDLSMASNTIAGETANFFNFENVIGSLFADTLTGDASDNVITDGGGTDTIDADGGDDTVVLSVDAVTDPQLFGGAGTDTLDLSNATSDIDVDLSQQGFAGLVLGIGGKDGGLGNGAGKAIQGFENVIGSAFVDTITGDANANVITDGAGSDTVDTGPGGPDTLILVADGVAENGLQGGASLQDLLDLSASTSNDIYDFSLASLTSADLEGGPSGGVVISFENVIFGSGDDQFVGGAIATNNTVEGRDGADTLDGGGGDDILKPGSDVASSDTLTGGAGADTFSFETNTDSLAAAADVITDFTAVDDSLEFLFVAETFGANPILNISAMAGVPDFVGIATFEGGVDVEVYYDDDIGNAVGGPPNDAAYYLAIDVDASGGFDVGTDTAIVLYVVDGAGAPLNPAFVTAADFI